MLNAGVLFSSSRRLIFGGIGIALLLIRMSLSGVQERPKEIFSEAKRQFCVRNRDVRMYAQPLQ